MPIIFDEEALEFLDHLTENLEYTFSFAACVSSLILLALAIIQLIKPTFQFWPPPKNTPWKKATFMLLFRILVYGLFFASLLNLWREGLQSPPIASAIAAILFLCGFIVAFWATGALGWSNAFGAKEGLRTGGIFAYSRNPIYVATWLGLAGWAILVPTALITISLAFWALLYLAAVFLEERWLRKEYGASFVEFCNEVRRFF